MVSRDERAQLMLVGAITIAVIFLGLVAVLNSGLYTSNVAPRAGLSATADAETFVDGVEHDAPILLGSAAEDAVEGEVYAFESVIRDEIDRYETYVLNSVGSERAATVGVGLNRTATGDGGLVVDHDPNTEFGPADDPNDPGWTVARGATDTGGQLTVYRFPTRNASGDATFALEADDGSDEWRLELYWNETAQEAHVRSVDDSGELADCTIQQEQASNTTGVTLDLSEGRVEGTSCSFPVVDNGADELGDPVDTPYDLKVRRDGPGDHWGRGTYAIATDGDIDDSNVVEGGPSVSDAPYWVPRLEAAVLDLRYTAPSLRYETTIDVAPTPVSLPPPPLSGRGLVFVNDSTPGLLSSLPSNRAIVRSYEVDDARVIGPAEIDFDADRRIEVPYVDPTGMVRIVDGENETAALTAGSQAASANSRLAVGRWNRSDVSVFYAGTNSNYIYRVTPGGSPAVVVDATVEGNGVSAPIGPADIDGDSADEFVYIDGSQQLRYLDDDGTPEVKIENGGAGQNYGPGIGPAHDFDDDGTARIPYVDGSNNLRLIDADGNRVTLQGGVDKSSLAVRDVNADRDIEIVYLKGGRAYFLEGVGTGTPVEQALQQTLPQGNTTNVTVSQGQGVA